MSTRGPERAAATGVPRNSIPDPRTQGGPAMNPLGNALAWSAIPVVLLLIAAAGYIWWLTR
jgi:hypothetical protein